MPDAHVLGRRLDLEAGHGSASQRIVQQQVDESMDWRLVAGGRIQGGKVDRAIRLGEDHQDGIDGFRFGVP